MNTPVIRFQHDGSTCEYVPVQQPLEHEHDRVRRTAPGNQPQVIATLKLADDRTVEVHGCAQSYTWRYSFVAWVDDNLQHCNCWVPADCVRDPADGEWHGHHVSR